MNTSEGAVGDRKRSIKKKKFAEFQPLKYKNNKNLSEAAVFLR